MTRNVWEARKKQLAERETAKPKAALPMSNELTAAGGSTTGRKGGSSVTNVSADKWQRGQETSSASPSARSGSVTRPLVNGQPIGAAPRSLSAESALQHKGWTDPAPATPSMTTRTKDNTVNAHLSPTPSHVASRPVGSSSSRRQTSEHHALTSTTTTQTSGSKPVASAIGDSMKKVNGPSAETDDGEAWLARIHLLNGGQNMPKYGAFGSNSASVDSSSSPAPGADQEEAQAVQEAERAVAVAWSAGRAVSDNCVQAQRQQQQIQQQSPSRSAASLSLSSHGTSVNDAASPSAVGADPSTAHSTHTPAIDESSKANDLSRSFVPSSVKSSKSPRSSDKKLVSEQGLGQKGHTNAPPSFEDVTKWPAPVEAVKQTTHDKTKNSSGTAVSAQTLAPTQGEKSIYETLSELQVEVVPGATSHASSANIVNGRRGKQWISIVPNITHASSSQKPSLRAGDARNRGSNKQARKEKGGQRQVRSPHGASAKREGPSAKGAAVDTAVVHQPVAPPAALMYDVHEAVVPQAKLHFSPSLASKDPTSSHAEASSPIEQVPFASRGTGGTGSRPYSPASPGVSGPAIPNGILPSKNGQAYSPARGAGSYAMAPTFAPRTNSIRPGESPKPASYHSNALYGVAGAHGSGWNAAMSNVRPSFQPQKAEKTAQTGTPFPTGTSAQLLAQVEFYFSQRNLEGDFFLRQKMDSQGWVGIAVLASFKRVQSITTDMRLIEDALLYSVVLDVDTERKRVRRRYGWELFVLPEGANVAASMQPSATAEAYGSTSASATPTASRGSTGQVSPPSSFSRSSEDVSIANGHTDDSNKGSKFQAGDDDDQILGIVASSGLGGTLDS